MRFENVWRLFLAALFFFPDLAFSQEFEGPLPRSIQATHQQKSGARPTALTLPFFDDFNKLSSSQPDPNLWLESSVYVNNTFAAGIKSVGCASFDAFDRYNRPYDSMNPYHQVYADSLTSKPIDLSGLQPSDSIYLSFLYQAKGWGFAPKPEDSLIVFFRRGNGAWQRVWWANEDAYTDFRFAMIPIVDTQFFNAEFQFRIINKATAGISNSHWHLDYVLLDQNRNHTDTLIRDIAYTKNPVNLLNDFTSMPFRHFKTNPSAFLKNAAEAFVRNNGDQNAQLQFGMRSRELVSNNALGTETGTGQFNANQENSIFLSRPAFENFQINNPDGLYVFEQTYFIESLYPNEPTTNDTIRQQQIFSNYFAYDDGSAEQTYFLNLFPNALGKIAVEFALYEPDTVRGVSIYLPREIPPGSNKEFSFAIYQDLAINGGQDVVAYQENFLFPEYTDSVNKFTTYPFQEPVPLGEGTFYLVLIQAAGGGSDSLSIGLDKNREGANHRYYNVEGYWQNSTIDGALLMRPLVGSALPPASLHDLRDDKGRFRISPNPVTSILQIVAAQEQATKFRFALYSIDGKKIQEGQGRKHTGLDLSELANGTYLLQLIDDKGIVETKKVLKQ